VRAAGGMAFRAFHTPWVAVIAPLTDAPIIFADRFRGQMGHASIQAMAPYQHQETDQLVIAVNKRNADRVALSGPGHTCSHTNRLTASDSA
jgi:hypothetical protein